MSDYKDKQRKNINKSLVRLIENGMVVAIAMEGEKIKYIALENVKEKQWEHQATPPQLQREIGKGINQQSVMIAAARNQALMEQVGEKISKGMKPC